MELFYFMYYAYILKSEITQRYYKGFTTKSTIRRIVNVFQEYLEFRLDSNYSNPYWNSSEKLQTQH
jgi:hypothetical protein